MPCYYIPLFGSGEKKEDWNYAVFAKGYKPQQAISEEEFESRFPYVPPQLSPEEQLAAFTAAIQARLDAFAQTRNYDGILSAASYALDANPTFRAEGQYAVQARGLTWAKAYELMGAVASGSRPMPSLAEVLAELPPLAWPE